MKNFQGIIFYMKMNTKGDFSNLHQCTFKAISVKFHIETGHLICDAYQKTGFNVETVDWHGLYK